MGIFNSFGIYLALSLSVIQFSPRNALWSSILNGFPLTQEIKNETFHQIGSVVHVIDGDTLMVGKTKVRLLGVNTPEIESKKYHKKKECWGLQAKSFLEDLTLGKTVRLESDPLSEKKDRYGRTLSWVYIDNQLVNLKIIQQGYGFAMRNFPNSKKKEMIQAEKQAKELNLGVWVNCPVDCGRGYCRVN